MICVQAARSPLKRDASGSACPLSKAFIAGCNHSINARTSLNRKSADTLDNRVEFAFGVSGVTGGDGLIFLARGWTQRWYSKSTAMQCRHMGSSGKEQLNLETR